MTEAIVQRNTMDTTLVQRLKAIIAQQKAEITQLNNRINNLTENVFSINHVISEMPGYVYWKDKNSVYRGCNNNLANICNLRCPEDIIGKTDSDFEWGKHLSENFIKDDIYVIATGKEHTSVYELPSKRADGNSMWVKTSKVPIKIHDKITGVIAIACDITDQKIEAKKACQDKMFVEDIIYNLPGLVYWKNKKSQYVGFNRNVVVLSGLDRNQLMGKKDTELNWGAKEADSFIKDDQEVMDTGIVKVTEHEIPIKRHNGQFMTVRTEKSRLKNRHGDMVGLLGVAVDITDQKEAEARLKEEKERVEKANLIKTEFIRNMEHDIRTPFSGVWGMANLLWEQETDPEKKELLGDITQCAKELLDYCNGILDFSKIEAGTLPLLSKKFDVKELINKITIIEKPAAIRKKLIFQIEHDKEIPNILVGDRYRLYRVLINLISNAIKFTQEGTVILKTTLIKHQDNRDILVRFTVKDTGMGIPHDKIDYIYEKFSRLTPANQGTYKGMGLGLKIVKQFIDEMDGEIDVESEQNKGTSFYCTLPFKLPLTNDFVDDTQWK